MAAKKESGINYTDILKQIREKTFAPVYFLCGEEEYFIDLLTEAFDNQVLDESQKDFDYAQFFGQDIKKNVSALEAVMAHCRRFPLMSPYQLVMVKGAQLIEKWEPLEAYLKAPTPTTILVFCHKKKVDGRKSIFNQIKKAGVFYEAAKIKDTEFAAWIKGYLQENKLKVSASALHFLSECLEANLRLAANELSKLVVNLPDGTEVNEDHIERFIGINKEYNVFSLTKAFDTGDVVKVRKIVNHFKANPADNPLQLIVPTLYKHFCKVLLYHALQGKVENAEMAARLGVAPYYVKDYASCARWFSYARTAQIISILKSYDLLSKGVENNSKFNKGEDLLEDLVYRLTH